MNRNSRNPGYSNLFRIALPMVVSQASETVMLFADRLFLSWLGKGFIAASMSGGLSAFVFASLFTGTVGYVNALTAQYYGADRREQCSRTVSQGFYLSLAFYPLILLLIPAVGWFFRAAGHSENQIHLEFSYFRILMAGGILALIRSTLVGFFLGIGKTRIVMAANIAGMTVNIPLNYLLIFGKAGFPAMGIEGAAWGTIGGSLVIAGILFIAYRRQTLYREFRKEGIWKPRADLIRKILRYGLPTGIEIFLNVFAFNVFIQLMHSYSADVAAAVTITFNYDMLAFIPMLGVGFATTALVGQQMGAENPPGAEKITWMALKTAWSYAAVMMLLFLFGAETLVGLFGGGLTAGDGEVLRLAAILLRLAALYTLADVTQIVFAGALRGAGDTRWVMTASVVLHWIMALISFLLIRRFRVSPVLVWCVFILFIMALGVIMFLRFLKGPWRTLRIIREPAESPAVISEPEFPQS